ncbi:MAG: hypothetical protein OEO79_19270 [Gemmatimonadota bacterium]|nr:hypothetical protein [Gemmatimonadota bacterium]
MSDVMTRGGPGTVPSFPPLEELEFEYSDTPPGAPPQVTVGWRAGLRDVDQRSAARMALWDLLDYVRKKYSFAIEEVRAYWDVDIHQPHPAWALPPTGDVYVLVAFGSESLLRITEQQVRADPAFNALLQRLWDHLNVMSLTHRYGERIYPLLQPKPGP